MKRAISFLLVLVMCLSLCACGKSKATKEAEEAINAIGEVSIDSSDAISKAEKLYGILTDSEKADVSNRLVLVDARETFDALKGELVYANAKEVYEKLSDVQKMCEDGMDDIYGAWYFGIYKAKKSYSVFLEFASETPHLTSTELKNAAASLCYTDTNLQYDWQKCLWVAEEAIAARGDYDVVQSKMKEAEQILQKLTNEYDDYTYYPKIKEFYSSVDAYVNFFVQPSGSFEQLKDTINNYENSTRTLKSDVSFLFSK